jgi:hypothetical protein
LETSPLRSTAQRCFGEFDFAKSAVDDRQAALNLPLIAGVCRSENTARGAPDRAGDARPHAYLPWQRLNNFIDKIVIYDQ